MLTGHELLADRLGPDDARVLRYRTDDLLAAPKTHTAQFRPPTPNRRMSVTAFDRHEELRGGASMRSCLSRPSPPDTPNPTRQPGSGHTLEPHGSPRRRDRATCGCIGRAPCELSPVCACSVDGRRQFVAERYAYSIERASQPESGDDEVEQPGEEAGEADEDAGEHVVEDEPRLESAQEQRS